MSLFDEPFDSTLTMIIWHDRSVFCRNMRFQAPQNNRTIRKTLLELARVVWIVFFVTGLLGGVYYLFSRDDMSLAIFLGGLGIIALPWSIPTKIMPAYGIYLLARGFIYVVAALLNYRWIARELQRIRSTG